MLAKHSKRSSALNTMHDTLRKAFITDQEPVVPSSMITPRFPSHLLMSIRSYNHFLTTLEQLLRRFQVTETTESYRYRLTFSEVSYHKPTFQTKDGNIIDLTPNEAIKRQIQYMGNVYVTVLQEVQQTGMAPVFEKTPNILLTDIPVCVGSKLCHTYGKDTHTLKRMGESPELPGGYFISSNGTERVIMTHERSAENVPYCFIEKGSHLKVQMKATINAYFYHVKNTSVVFNTTNKRISVSIPLIKVPVPLFILFRALQVETDREIFSHIMQGRDDDRIFNLLSFSAKEAHEAGVYTSEHALEYLNRPHIFQYNSPIQDEKRAEEARMTYLQKTILDGFLPSAYHMDPKYKVATLSYLVRKLFQTLFRERLLDDRDDIKNKRADELENLLLQLIRPNLKILRNKIRTAVNEHKTASPLPTIGNIITRGSLISNTLRHSIATGTWAASSTGSATALKGVSQTLNRISQTGAICQLRRTVTPTDTKAKRPEPRFYHRSQDGSYCQFETPEGQQVGTVKNYSLGNIPTLIVDPQQLILQLRGQQERLHIYESGSLPPNKLTDHVQVFLNGCLIYTVPPEHAENLHTILHMLKHHMYISPFISIAWTYEYNEIFIDTSPGRNGRWMMRVKPDGHTTYFEEWWPSFQRILSGIPSHQHWKTVLMPLRELSKLYPVEFPSSKIGTKETLHNGSCFEYLDTAERAATMVASSFQDLLYNYDMMTSTGPSKYIQYKYCEMHPSLHLGLIASLIPGSFHNPSVRNCYQSSMGKQAITIPMSMWPIKLTTTVVMLATTTSFYQSIFDRELGLATTSSSITSNVAVGTDGGANQEDSIIMNATAIAQGKYAVVSLRTYSVSERNARTSDSKRDNWFGFPPESAGEVEEQRHNYQDAKDRIIDPRNNLARLGVYVKAGDIIIPRYTSNVHNKRFTYRDISIVVRNGEEGYVDLVEPGPGEPALYETKGGQVAHVRVASYRKPTTGDKFASRHAQKGTIGDKPEDEKMPRVSGCYGTIHIMMNPHAYPSRMTIGQLIESKMSMVGVVLGRCFDATAWRGHDEALFGKRKTTSASPPIPKDAPPDMKYSAVIDPQTYYFDEFDDILLDHGINPNLDWMVYSGRTGRPLNTPMFAGVAAYQRLKHMVRDKIFTRTRGPRQQMTHQPTEGRIRSGGLRLGEMERDALAAHGAAHILQERYMPCSDQFRVYVDSDGNILTANPEKGIYYRNKTPIIGEDVFELHIPYAMKLLIQEFMSTGIYMRLKPQSVTRKRKITT